MSATLIERLAPAIRSAQPPHESIGALKSCLLHYLTCAFEARDLPCSRQARTLAARAVGTASIVGSHERSSVAEAAFANAVAGHALVREDMHTAAVSHLGVVVLPAMIALAQRHRVTGLQFAAACIVGYEVGARLGRALVTPSFMQHWRPTGFTGPLAAAAAGGRLLGLSASAVGSALAFAANMACGLNQWPHEGGEEMFFHPGVAARNALMAVELAQLGAYGSAGALDGRAGLFAAVGSDEAILRDIALFPGGAAEIASVYHKALPVCNFAQTPCQAALKLVRDKHFSADTISSVTIMACDAAIRYPGCDSRGPFERVLQAKMSIPFCVAAALVDRDVNEASFVALNRKELRRLSAVTTLAADGLFNRAFPARQGAEVIVTLRDGTSHRARMDDQQVATAHMVSARFLESGARVVGAARAEQIARGIASLETLEEVESLLRMTEGPTTAG